MQKRYIGLLLGMAATVIGARAATADHFGPGQRVLVDAHNAYPSEGQFADRIDRALSTGLPVAIEQDLFWYIDPNTGVGRSVVAHSAEDAPRAPTFDDYFFKKVAPLMERALKEQRRDEWPLITLNLDFKTNEPEHHAAVLALLAAHDAWLTTAQRTASPSVVSPLKLGPMLVLTGSNDEQEHSFYDRVPVGQRLRLFGAIRDVQAPGQNKEERAKAYGELPVNTLIPNSATDYRRWANFSWSVIETGGPSAGGTWRSVENERLKQLVARAHTMNLWIRFYTLNGHSPQENQGWEPDYNFGSLASVSNRWRAAISARVDFIATDQYEALAKIRPRAHTP